MTTLDTCKTCGGTKLDPTTQYPGSSIRHKPCPDCMTTSETPEPSERARANARRASAAFPVREPPSAGDGTHWFDDPDTRIELRMAVPDANGMPTMKRYDPDSETWSVILWDYAEADVRAEPPREEGCPEPQPDGTPCVIRHTQDSDINHFSDASLADALDELDQLTGPREEGGAALEAAREAFVQQLGYWMSKDVEGGVVNFHALNRDLDTIITLAAARAPGPVGGEAELRRLLHGVLWHQQEHRLPLDECPGARCYPIAEEVKALAAAAPVEPGGEA